jgi:phosphate transport system substrate-binding protein
LTAPRIARWLVAALALAAASPVSAQSRSEPAEDFTLRKNLRIAVSPVMRAYAEAAAQYFQSRRDFPPAALDFQITSRAFARFCQGIGVDFPDVVVASRRISRNEFRVCGEKGVGEIVEIAAGYEVLVLAAPLGSVPFNVTAETLYRALALEVPRDGAFYVNAAARWSDVAPRLPETGIKVALPPAGSGMRHLFDDRAMEGGCRYVPEIRDIFAAADRVAKCVAPREDGRIAEIQKAEDVTAFLSGADPGTLAAMGRQTYEKYLPTLPLLPFEGVLPTQQSVENGEYLLGRKLYFYFKVGHMHGRKGYGVTAGLQEFLLDVASEQAIDPGGFFERQGLMLLPPSERARQRLEALLQRPMTR